MKITKIFQIILHLLFKVHADLEGLRLGAKHMSSDCQRGKREGRRVLLP